MKAHRLNKFIVLLVLSLGILVSCDDDNDDVTNTVSNEELEILITSALVDEGGLLDDIDLISSSLAGNAQRSSEFTEFSSMDLSAVNCNQTVSNTYQNSNSVGNRSWTIISNWTWTLNCDIASQSASFDLSGNGSLDFDGPNLSKDITRTHDFNITGLGPASNTWNYNATHNRTGFTQFNGPNQNSFDTNLDFGSTDLLISKATEEIISGTFTIDFTATFSNGNTFNRGATIVFTGNQTATVTFNNGFTFNISW